MGIDRTSRAQGCLLGQLAGDALGSLVEFQSPDEIRRSYPDGVRELADGGTWNTIAGQPTDDSEMALLLARLLVKTGSYDPEAARKEYQYWLSSDPFDCGMTISAGLRGNPNTDSQANGAMMRISPLGIFTPFNPDATAKSYTSTSDSGQQTCPLNQLYWIPSTRLPKSRQRTMSTSRAGC